MAEGAVVAEEDGRDPKIGSFAIREPEKCKKGLTLRSVDMSHRSALLVLTIVVIAGAISTSAQASSLPANQSSPESALQRLSHVEKFAFGGVGFAGVTSVGEKDFRLLMSQKNSLELMQKLYAIGNMQAKAYALTGIRELDPKQFSALTKAVPKQPISVMAGCIVSTNLMSEVVRHIAAGDYSRRTMLQSSGE